MATSATWANYHSLSMDKGTDEQVLSMIRDIVSVIRDLERIYGAEKSQLIVRGLLMEWQGLSGIANARGLQYEHP